MVTWYKKYDDRFCFAYGEYMFGDTYITTLTDDGETYCDISVNLIDQPFPDENEIYVYDVPPSLYQIFKDNFVEKEIRHVKVGTFGKGVLVKLKDGFEKNMMEI